MNYAKLTDDGLEFATNPFLSPDEMQHFNPFAEQMMKEGYKPVIYTDPDTPLGYVAICHWHEYEDEIVQLWEYRKIDF